MAERYQVECVNKADRYNLWERITPIGGSSGGGWRLSQPEAIAGIEAGRWTFYVRAAGKEVEGIVATSQFGNKYLTTEGDGEQPNNLLSLLECR